MSGPMTNDGNENRCKENSFFKTLAPTQKEAFSRLWATLSTSLLKETNPVVCLAGPRGYGKRHILNHCMNGVYHEHFTKTALKFTPHEEDAAAPPKMGCFIKRPRTKLRVVRISGVLLKGDDGAAAKEIVRQLSTQAKEEFQGTTIASQNQSFSSACDGSGVVSHSSSFHSNVALLDESLKRARVDKVPIWIIVHDVDAFAATASSGGNKNTFNKAYSTNSVSATKLQNNKQVLLYHLLDMAASEETYMGVLWTTSRFNLMEMLEKRIRSRAVGTQVVLQLTKHNSQSAASALVSTIGRCRQRNGLDDWVPCLHAMMRGRAFQKEDKQENCEDFVLLKQMLSDPRDPVTVLLQRQIFLGQTIRWFQRLMTLAKSRIAGADAPQATRLPNNGTHLTQYSNEKLYLLKRSLSEACDFMGCEMNLVLHDDVTEHDKNKNKRIHSKLEGVNSTSRQTYNHNPRVRSVIDLSICQLLLVCSARRIIVRDSIEAQNEDEAVLLRKSTGHQRGLQCGVTLGFLGASISTIDYHRPLTFDRIYDEYHAYFVKPYSNGDTHTNRRGGHQVMFSMLIFSKQVMQSNFVQLLDSDVFRPAMDHVGSTLGAYHYKRRFVGPRGGGIIYSAGSSKGNTPGALELNTAPLHIMANLEFELYPLIQCGDLPQCTTVVKEWGMTRF